MELLFDLSVHQFVRIRSHLFGTSHVVRGHHGPLKMEPRLYTLERPLGYRSRDAAVKWEPISLFWIINYHQYAPYSISIFWHYCFVKNFNLWLFWRKILILESNFVFYAGNFDFHTKKQLKIRLLENSNRWVHFEFLTRILGLDFAKLSPTLRFLDYFT